MLQRIQSVRGGGGRVRVLKGAGHLVHTFNMVFYGKYG
jgi:hypothetical protein